MIFKIDDFIIATIKKIEQLQEQIACATAITTGGKPTDFKWQNKTREFTIFYQLYFKGVLITDNIFDFIGLVEAIKGFAGNKYTDEKVYKINDNMSARMVQKDDLRYLKLELSKHTLFLDKLECSILGAQLSKIAQRCEAWQELEA